jgi:hypothetical protein
MGVCLLPGGFMESGSIPFGQAESSQISIAPAATPEHQNVPGALAAALRKPRRFSGCLRRASLVLGVGILVAAGSMACLLAVSWVRSQGAVQVVQTQVEEIRAGKVEEAYALFSSGYQAGVSLPMFRRWLRHQGRFGKVHKFQFWGRSVWGKTAVLWGSFQDNLGHTYPVRYLLIREKGSWRIDGFHVSAESPDSFPDTIRIIQI